MLPFVLRNTYNPSKVAPLLDGNFPVHFGFIDGVTSNLLPLIQWSE